MATISPEAKLLEHVYHELGLDEGTLLSARSEPASDDAGEWRAVGDWLLLADRVGADRVFFVNDDPVLVFSALPGPATPSDIADAYRRAWSLSRPRCLFLAAGAELMVFALDRPPAENGDSSTSNRPIEVVERAADVSERLARFHRDSVESGAAFEATGATPRGSRADEQLLRDVTSVASALTEDGLDRASAHALIERSILARYLEDREVITSSYFQDIAKGRGDWTKCLQSSPGGEDTGPASSFIACLSSPSLTSALFDQLAGDFNGDLFIPHPDESPEIEGRHLKRLQGFLRGTEGATPEFDSL